MFLILLRGGVTIRIQGPVLVHFDMGIVAPLHHDGVVDWCWCCRRGFKGKLTSHRGQICMQMMTSSSSSGGCGSDSSRSSSAGGCGHGECTHRKEHCGKKSGAGRHGFGDEVMVVIEKIYLMYVIQAKQISLSLTRFSKADSGDFLSIVKSWTFGAYVCVFLYVFFVCVCVCVCVCVEWEMEKLRERNIV